MIPFKRRWALTILLATAGASEGSAGPASASPTHQRPPANVREVAFALPQVSPPSDSESARAGTNVGKVSDRIPTLFLIGDSTVKNGSGKGDGALWGWGHPIAGFFDKAKLRVENRALGGRSSRTYLTEGLWDKVLAAMNPRDFVLIQFGHNDGGSIAEGDRPRASLKGNNDESREVTVAKTGKKEVVRSYGWYLRKYISDARAKGATPIVLSPVPRNMWKQGKVNRAANDYGKWASEAAKAEGVAFIDLNEIVAAHYEAEGAEKVQAQYFTSADHTHTTAAGARLNAASVVEGLQRLKDCRLSRYLATPPHTPDSDVHEK